ncbi:hypothetical protein F511_29195 [Dorcoceras hygrometricum]|uniref:Uncharacterized protein n=1 Tax=Dorcoceras hygrometricum TaxID=472368 RepID=A0A2Z7C8P4_9LAMI|nr:hypothetical protein F511_29195 [Dorcoceras hygrometricum]
MTRSCNWCVASAAVILLLVATQAAETPNINPHCMAECFFDCTQIKIFTDGECKRECVFACARHNIRKTSEDDETKFFPPWI